MSLIVAAKLQFKLQKLGKANSLFQEGRPILHANDPGRLCWDMLHIPICASALDQADMPIADWQPVIGTG